MYALNLDSTTGRVLSATYHEFAPDDAVLVASLPEGDLSDYLYIDGKFIHDPIPKDGNAFPVGGAIITGQNAEETTIEAQLYVLNQKG